MLVEISKEEIEALEASIKCAIKSNFLLQMLAAHSPDNGLVSLKDVLEANVLLSKSFSFIEKIKEKS